MTDALWPFIAFAGGLLLIAFFVGLGYVFKTLVGSLIGVVLFSGAVLLLFLSEEDGMGRAMIIGSVVFLGLPAVGIIFLLGFAGNMLKEKKQKAAMIIVGLVSLGWASMLLTAAIGSL